MKCLGRHGVITTPHPLASEAGRSILAAGGTAIDAMIAAGAALAVVFPHMCGLGGDALWLLYDRRPRGLLGIGQAGVKALPQPITERGPGAVATTAGALASWQLAREISQRQWGSRMPLAHLLDAAIQLAQSGVEVSESQAFWLQQRREILHHLPDLAAISQASDGTLLEAGHSFRQPQLAHTLRQLRKRGLMDFYHGGVADALARGLRELPCSLGSEDLRATTAREVDLVKVRYRKGDYYNFPAPSQGLYTAKALHSLNPWDLSALGRSSADYYHLLIETIKQGLAQRNRELCDPDFAHLHSQAIASGLYPLDRQHAAPWAEDSQPADTVWLAATDSQGRTACLMQSLFHDFGSGCVIGDTGVIWHNRAAGFNPHPHHANAWGEAKRPAHTLNPSCYLADDGRRFFFGSQGGDGQPQTQLVLATQLIDFDLAIEDAIAAPRFLQGRSFFGARNCLKIERPLAERSAAQLAAKGHEIEIIPPLSPYTGQAGILLMRQDGTGEAVHDPRGEGVALTVPALRR